MNIDVINYNNILDSFIREAKSLGWNITDYSQYFRPTGQLPDIAVLWNDVIPAYVQIVGYYKENRVPVVIVQHGINGFDHYFKKNYKAIADYHLAWDEFDQWCAKYRGSKNVSIVGCPLWDNPEIKPVVSDRFYLYAPRHALWEKSLIIEEYADAKIRALYHNASLVVKATSVIGDEYKIPNYLDPKDTYIFTNRLDSKHIGTCLYLTRHCEGAWIQGKQTIRYLYDNRNENLTGATQNIINKIKEISC